MLRDGGLGFCSAVVGGGGGWLTGSWDFWWVVVAGLMGLWDFCCCCWILYRSMDFIVAGLFTVLWILHFADYLVVLVMFSDQYCWCRGFTDLKYKFLSLAPGKGCQMGGFGWALNGLGLKWVGPLKPNSLFKPI
jgi:hypothetical protein